MSFFTARLLLAALNARSAVWPCSLIPMQRYSLVCVEGRFESDRDQGKEYESREKRQNEALRIFLVFVRFFQHIFNRCERQKAGHEHQRPQLNPSGRLAQNEVRYERRSSAEQDE